MLVLETLLRAAPRARPGTKRPLFRRRPNVCLHQAQPDTRASYYLVAQRHRLRHMHLSMHMSNAPVCTCNMHMHMHTHMHMHIHTHMHMLHAQARCACTPPPASNDTPHAHTGQTMSLIMRIPFIGPRAHYEHVMSLTVATTM